MKILDCESIESTYKSLKNILGVKRSDLCQLFDSIKVYEEMRESNSDFLLSRIQEKTNCKTHFDKTCWFHCTRTQPSNAFEEGILPLDQVVDKIWDFLFGLTEGQVASQQWADFRHSMQSSNSHWAHLYRMKLADPRLHGGPNAFLIRETTIEMVKSSTYWNYFEIPEIVDDICKCCPCKVDLRHKFITNTAPCMVKFIDYKANIGSLSKALIYAYHKHRNLDLLPASNCCFSANGTPIPKDRILKVEFMPESMCGDIEKKTIKK